MKKLLKIFIVSAVLLCTVFHVRGLKQLLPTTSTEVQEEAVRNLVKRTIGEKSSHLFDVTIDAKLEFRSFQITKRDDGVIFVIGFDGVSAAKGFHYYLKYYLHKDISWINTDIELLRNSDLPNVTITSKSASDFIYYQNVCTWSYSFAWWGWSTWERHIDWMAMMGISLTIAPVQEHIWNELYLDMGLTTDEINDHFAGPAFQAWQRMGNIRGWGGPITASYRRMQFLLQQKILKAQRDFGMTISLPAFAGHVPKALGRIYPKVNFTAVEQWNNFPNQYCCIYFLDPNEQLFQDIGRKFLLKTVEKYGTNHIYFADPFNEIQPRLADSNYMNTTAFHIYESMRNVDANAVWLLQGWMFVKNIFWTDDLIKSFLTAVPSGKLLVLDLQSEQFPQYERTLSYHGQPFIWCMLHNFGGTLGMHGAAEIVNTRIRLARDMVNSSMIGVGITPEGIHQNYIMYALTLERAWLHDDVDLQQWFDTFVDARYGVEDERLRAAWQFLRNSVYAFHSFRKLRGKYTITRRPSLNIDTWSWYNASSIHQAWLLLLSANGSVAATKINKIFYENDLVDVTRQFLQTLADHLYVNLIDAYRKKQLDRFSYIAKMLRHVFEDLERILLTNKNFMLGPWLQSAKAFAQNQAEERLYELNARNQITTWGPNGQILDYATKQWAGIVRDYYQPRWELFLEMLKQSLQNNSTFNRTQFIDLVKKEIENPFSIQIKTYPTETVGNAFRVSQTIFINWTSTLYTQVYTENAYLNVKIKQ